MMALRIRHTLTLALWMMCALSAYAASPMGTAMFLGDSNIWLSGDNCTGEDSWVTWFCRANSFQTVYNLSRSGATWSCTSSTERDLVDSVAILSDKNVMYNQVERVIAGVQAGKYKAPTHVYLSAGANDVWFLPRRPDALQYNADSLFCVSDQTILEMAPNELVTIALAMRYACLRLRSAFPDVHIVVLSPLQTTKTTKQRVTQASEILSSCARRLHVECIRMDGDDWINRDEELKHFVLTKDGTHTSPQGAQKVSNQILRLLSDKATK